MSKRANLIGRRFGKLKVISLAYIDSPIKRTYWNCICNCGNTTVVRGSTLNEGLTKSCGCLLGSKLKKGEAATNYIFKSYKEQAKSRNLAFNLSKKNFKKLIFSKCYYCGEKFSNKTNNKQYNGNIKYNGIDRINNNYGYSLKNCVPCCKTCNFLKKGDKQNIFLTKIKKIYEYKIKGK